MRKNTSRLATAAKPPVTTAKTAVASNSPDTLLNRLELWLTANSRPVFWTIFALSLIFALLHFDVKISEGNDDALYIEGGYNYAQDFTGYYFTANAPLYPMLLGFVIKVVGLNLIALKVLSLFFFLINVIMFFYAFKEHVPFILLFPVLIIIGTNSNFLYYASQTYTESLFLFIQSCFFFSLFSIIKKSNENVRASILNWLVFGLIMFLLVLCKNVAIGAVVVVIFYFTINKKWSFAIFSTVAFLCFRIPFELLKQAIWGDLSKSSQLVTLLQIDPYDASKGQESFSGMINRFFDNYSLYITKRIPQILGFKNFDDTSTSVLLGFIMLVLFSIGIFQIIKKGNNQLLVTAIYFLVLAAITFIVLQTRWDQPRLILILLPILLFVVLFGLYQFTIGTSGFKGVLYLAITGLLISVGLFFSLEKAFKNIPVLSRNLNGDIFYGYTPDWENYLRLSQWCADSLSSESLVACRKAPMSFVYGRGMRFFPVYNVYAVEKSTGMSNPDSVLTYFKKENVTHVIVASLRRNPKKIDGYVINTLHRMLIPIAQKYPNKLALIKTMGNTEQAFLYKINY